MSKESSSSWRYLSSAGSKLSSLKTYISGDELPLCTTSPTSSQGGYPDREARQSWKGWAGQKIRDRQGISSTSVEIVEMFPGWAARRYGQDGDGRSQVPAPFGVEVFVSGFVSTRRNPENATRSQRAFVRLAKSFVGFPKNMDSTVPIESPAGQSKQVVDGVNVIDQPLLPQENADESSAVDILEQQLLQAQERILDDGDYVTESPPSSSTEELPLHDDEELQKNVQEQQHLPETPQDIMRRRLHNLENRIRHLWYSALPNRTVRLHLLVHPHKHRGNNPSTDNLSDPEEVLLNPENGHISSQDVTTAADGSFQAKFKVKWEDLSLHPRALHIAFEEKDHDLLVVAQLVPSSKIPRLNTILHPPTPSFSIPLISSPLTALVRTSVTHSPIRVISDIDDTVKRTGVVSGVRTVLSNVFANDFKDNIISGMAEWYTRMFNQGVRFHYVSNGPFSLLPILNEFFQISQLPPGSLKLRSYSGRSLFEGLVSAPATRKRGGVLEVLESFPDSKFILIGDTGEQDLELYAEIARDRPHQILGAFLRDVDADNQDVDPIPHPTGWKGSDQSPNESSSQSSASSGSFSSLLGRFPSYKSNDSKRSTSLPSSETSGQSDTEVAKPARSTSDTVAPFDHVGSNLRDKVLRKARNRAVYFGIGPLTSTPDREIPESELHFQRPDVQVSQLIPDPTVSGPNTANPSTSHSNQGFISEPPKPILPPSITNPRPLSTVSLNSEAEQVDSDNFGPFDPSQYVSDNGKRQTSSVKRRRTELQTRVYRARTQMPSDIFLRVFREPTDCVEVDKFLL